MAIYTITSDAKPSVRHRGYFYAYYDKPTSTGRACAVTFPASIIDIVKPGLQFDEETSVRWDDVLRTSVLELDFHEFEDLGQPSVPVDPEAGWGDPDVLPPSPPEPEFAPDEAELVAAAAFGNGHRPSTAPAPAISSQRPMRGPAHRKAEAQKAVEQGAQLPAAYLQINLEVSRSFLLQLRLLGTTVNEQRRADVAQKLCAIASIPYYRQIGVELSDDDIKGMTSI